MGEVLVGISLFGSVFAFRYPVQDDAVHLNSLWIIGQSVIWIIGQGVICDVFDQGIVL
jgi:hypothetical protein